MLIRTDNNYKLKPKVQYIWLKTGNCTTVDKTRWPSQRQRSYMVLCSELRKSAKFIVNVNKPTSWFGFQ